MIPDEVLRSFRRNAVHIRQALGLPVEESGRVQVEGGYLQDANAIERYKRLSIPVRRALSHNDMVFFERALACVAPDGRGPDGRSGEITRVRTEWARLQAELDSTIGLGGGKVPRRQILADWLEAVAFYDKLDRDRAYDRLIDRWGKAAESIGVQLTEDAARVILLLDELAASVLGEPIILPPPVKTPPPPPDPKESIWKRLFRRRETLD